MIDACKVNSVRNTTVVVVDVDPLIKSSYLNNVSV